MKMLKFLPLVDYGLGTGIIIVFGIVCIVLMLVVHSMITSDKKKDY